MTDKQPKRGDMLKALMRQRDDAFNRIEQLQRALSFWMPKIPDEAHPLHERAAKDAWLLTGYEGDPEKDAADLGWIELRESQL